MIVTDNSLNYTYEELVQACRLNNLKLNEVKAYRRQVYKRQVHIQHYKK